MVHGGRQEAAARPKLHLLPPVREREGDSTSAGQPSRQDEGGSPVHPEHSLLAGNSGVPAKEPERPPRAALPAGHLGRERRQLDRAGEPRSQLL